MRARSWLAVVVMIGLMASGAVAKDLTRIDSDTFGMMSRLHGPVFTSRAVFEGFETAVPPEGWTSIVANAETWKQDYMEAGSLEGFYSAYIHWNETVSQDESIAFTHTVDVAGGESILSFWMAGARLGEYVLNAAETVEINGTVVLDWDTTAGDGGHFVWEQHLIDLAAYDGQEIEIAFRYAGLNGAAHYVDAVMIDDGTGYTPPPPPDPPENDLCEGAINLIEQGLASFEIDLCTANDDYSAGDIDNGCTGYTSTGRDIVYKIYLREGDAFMATLQGSHDTSLWLATDCTDLAGTCVVGSDNTIGDGYEQIPPTDNLDWVVPADGWYFLVVDGWGDDVCSIVTLTFDSPMSNDDLSWGRVKSMFR